MLYLSSMNHFVETEQLLSQVSFLRYIGQIYEAFIDLEDFAKVDAKNIGETFTVNLLRWQQLTKEKEPRRIFAGGSGFFLAYVKHEVEQLIYKDWNNAKATLPTKEKDRIARLSELVGEAREIKETIAHRPYLEPISGCMVHVLDVVLSEYADTPKRPTINGVEMNFEPMQWNDNTNKLVTIFYDLSKKMLKNKRMVLDATPEQMKTFISLCFVAKDGKPIPKATLDTCFQEDKPEKRAKEGNKHDVHPYFEHEE